MNEPQPIWEILGITEDEYYQQYHTQPANENALEIQQSIAEETKTEEKIENFLIETNP
jgi:hypothetical protein